MKGCFFLLFEHLLKFSITKKAKKSPKKFTFPRTFLVIVKNILVITFV